MRDMFYNYEHHINKKDCQRPLYYPEEYKILESDQNIEIVTDIKGNEIGVKVRHNNAFSLYFSLDGEVEGGTISDLVSNSSISFLILDSFHNIVLEKTFLPQDVFLDRLDTIEINIDRNDAMKLKAESYGMKLSLSWPGGGYDLFSENNGKLIVR